jgi:hypothetical protein
MVWFFWDNDHRVGSMNQEKVYANAHGREIFSMVVSDFEGWLMGW